MYFCSKRTLLALHIVFILLLAMLCVCPLLKSPSIGLSLWASLGAEKDVRYECTSLLLIFFAPPCPHPTWESTLPSAAAALLSFPHLRVHLNSSLFWGIVLLQFRTCAFSADLCGDWPLHPWWTFSSDQWVSSSRWVCLISVLVSWRWMEEGWVRVVIIFFASFYV